MANLYYYLDSRRPHMDGTGTLKLGLNHNRKTAFHSLGIYLKPDEWNPDRQQVVARPDKKFQNVIIKKTMSEATLTLQRITLRHNLDDIPVKQILDMVVRGTDAVDIDGDDADYILPIYNEYITLCKKANTAATYRASLKSITEYSDDIDNLSFKDINVAWLRKYQQWLTEEKGMEVNGANVYLRNLRTIFNYALKNEYTNARYPFRDIDMSTTEPDKRFIDWDKFVEWAAYPMEDYRDFYRDLFLLSFYLCGIRPVDLLNVKKSQVVDGRLIYWPEKLNGRTKMSIKIEPEAWEIIHRYEGKDHLLKIMDERSDYKAFMQHWNKALRAIGLDEKFTKTGRKGRVYTKVKHNGLIPYISVYYARSCWASYAYNKLDVQMDVISQGLGHKNGLRVTNFYVKRTNDRVDEANRRMIDLLKKDMAAYKAKRKTA